jgi:signal transduction histidine kinase
MESTRRQFSIIEPERNRMDWSAWLSLQLAVFGVISTLCIVIWGLTGGAFWPIWVALGLALPLALQLSIREAVKARRRWRGLAVQGAVSAVLVGLFVFIWALTGGYFWPIWPALGLGAALALHAVVLNQLATLRPRERELADRVDVLTRTRRGALDVQAAELRRIERNLHDGAQARLVALTMKLGRAEGRLEEHPEVADLVRSAREDASAAIGELRDLARGIAPPVLADRGLEAAVDALGKRSAIEVAMTARITRRPPPVVETAAYFVVAEALTNVAKHAPHATAHVALLEDPGHLIVEVSDNGPGGARPDGGGLSGLRQRVQALDGTLAVVSNAGEGTVIRAELPCE